MGLNFPTNIVDTPASLKAQAEEKKEEMPMSNSFMNTSVNLNNVETSTTLN
jgi:hypothetical protein